MQFLILLPTLVLGASFLASHSCTLDTFFNLHKIMNWIGANLTFEDGKGREI